MTRLGSVIGVLGKIESVDIAVHRERCVAVRNRNATCSKCADACTSGAIKIEDNEMVITPDLCIGCGTCATVCPTCALEARRPNDAELMQYTHRSMETNDGYVVFACRKAVEANKNRYDRSAVVEVACLGRLEETALVCLVGDGATSITLVRGNCEDCPNKTGLQTTELVLDTVETLLAAWGRSFQLELTDTLPERICMDSERAKQSEAVDGVSRRSFFTQLKRGMQGAVADAVDSALSNDAEKDTVPVQYVKVQDDGSLPHFIPNRRERLLDALDRMGRPVEETIDTRLWGRVHIDENLCSACRMCTTFCPTGALYKYDDSDEEVGVEHFPTDCVQCRTCADICPQGALSVSSLVSTEELIECTFERYKMDAGRITTCHPKQILEGMRKFIRSSQVYER